MMNKTIFLIDDDPLYLTILSTKLWQWGYAVKTFLSVEEALPKLNENPDLIVLDHNFKYSDSKGSDYIPTIKSQVQECALLYVTSETSPNIVNTSLERGADMYLKKDNDLFSQINDAIEQLLDKKKNSLWQKVLR